MLEESHFSLLDNRIYMENRKERRLSIRDVSFSDIICFWLFEFKSAQSIICLVTELKLRVRGFTRLHPIATISKPEFRVSFEYLKFLTTILCYIICVTYFFNYFFPLRIGIKCQRTVADQYHGHVFTQWKIKASLVTICEVMYRTSLVSLEK